MTSYIITPFVCGYLYGVAKTMENKTDENALVTFIDVASTGFLYAIVTDVATKNILPKGSGHITSGILLGVACYKIYNLFKKSI